MAFSVFLVCPDVKNPNTHLQTPRQGNVSLPGQRSIREEASDAQSVPATEDRGLDSITFSPSRLIQRRWKSFYLRHGKKMNPKRLVSDESARDARRKGWAQEMHRSLNSQLSWSVPIKARQRSPKYWSHKVKTVSTFPPEGTFTKDAATVARIMASKKVSPKGVGSGIRMIQFFINRAGKSLSPRQRRSLERAKEILQEKSRRKKS